ncbi:MAG: DUF4190 domain-containing protein [Bacteroidales bacterium]|nr:DUF4190 domain-containing protein [Bacteroidales bacterium]
MKASRSLLLLVFTLLSLLSNVFLSCVSERSYTENPRITNLHKNKLSLPWENSSVSKNNHPVTNISMPHGSIEQESSLLEAGKLEPGKAGNIVFPDGEQVNTSKEITAGTTGINPPVTLTASIDNQPCLFPYSALPDTTVSVPDSLKEPKASNIGNNEAKTQAKTIPPEKHPEYWAIASLVSALLCLIFAAMGVTFGIILFPIAAIVFGALGLRSSKRKMAMAGLIIGIIELILLILLIILIIVILANWTPIIFI